MRPNDMQHCLLPCLSVHQGNVAKFDRKVKHLGLLHDRPNELVQIGWPVVGHHLEERLDREQKRVAVVVRVEHHLIRDEAVGGKKESANEGHTPLDGHDGNDSLLMSHD